MKAAANLKTAATSDDERDMYDDFVASPHWVANFIVRHGLQSKTLHGEAGSVDDAAIAARMAEIREVCKEYEPACIFNEDETGLLYRLLPKISYLAVGENRKTVRGVKDMGAKNRVTAYMCTNADGSAKMPLSLIGTAANPRCFRNGKLPCKYYSQKNAWSDTRVFNLWWKDFLAFVRTFTRENVLLLMDNHSSHKDLVDPLGQVTVMEYPPNCTSKHQPMDQGVIQAWKTHYKSMLLSMRVDTMSSALQLREQARARGMKNGTKGLAEGHHAHLLDAAEIGVAAWEKVTQTTIARYVLSSSGVSNYLQPRCRFLVWWL